MKMQYFCACYKVWYSTWGWGDSPIGNMGMGIRILRTHINPGVIAPVCNLSLYIKTGDSQKLADQQAWYTQLQTVNVV